MDFGVVKATVLGTDLMLLMSYGNRRRDLTTLMLVLTLTLAAAAPSAQDCNVEQPDSLQISWTAPCEDGSWLLDPQTGCRLWDWHPDPEDTVTWSGACPKGLKEGAGIVQWFEHGRPIDRLEGMFEHGKRKGFGRYYWPAGQRFEGYYDDDLPNGQGTITIDGVSYVGIWRRGCLAHKDKLIAIGVPLSTCSGVHSSDSSNGARPARATNSSASHPMTSAILRSLSSPTFPRWTLEAIGTPAFRGASREAMSLSENDFAR